MGWTESSSAADRLRYDVHVRLLHSVHVPQPDLLRVSYCEQPGAPTAGWPGSNGDWVLRHGIHTLLDLQCGKQRVAQREFVITFFPTTIVSMFGISNFSISVKWSWYNMADVLVSPLPPMAQVTLSSFKLCLWERLIHFVLLKMRVHSFSVFYVSKTFLFHLKLFIIILISDIFILILPVFRQMLQSEGCFIFAHWFRCPSVCMICPN